MCTGSKRMMKPSTSSRPMALAILITVLLLIIQQQVDATQEQPVDTYTEDLFLTPLIDGKLFAQFQFTLLYRKGPKDIRWENKFEVFPLSIADIIASSDLHALKFSLTKGNWNYKNWGYSSRPSPPGAQIVAEFSRYNEDPKRSWRKLTNALAGKFCSSLVSANDKTVVASKFALDPTQFAQVKDDHSHNLTSSKRRVYYANLPEETFCTENLTPWKKILPCYSKKSGLSSLLNAVNVLKSSYSSLAVDIDPVSCASANDGECDHVRLRQTISIVFNPIQMFEGKMIWSLSKIFGNSILDVCPMASSSRVLVDITKIKENDNIQIYPSSYSELELNAGAEHKRIFAVFDVESLMTEARASSKKTELNIGAKQIKSQIFKQLPFTGRPQLPVYFHTHIAGKGAHEGSLVATVTNRHSRAVRINYLQVLPHYIRVFMHTLNIETNDKQKLAPDFYNYDLARDDTSSLIELRIEVPARSETRISYRFVRAYLKCSEYKPDAHKGLLLGSASISIEAQGGFNKHLVFPAGTMSLNNFNGSTTDDIKADIDNGVFRVYARPLLVILPTPDFSMSYNVICFVCTVLVTAFGAIHRKTTQKQIIRVDANKLKAPGSDNSVDACTKESLDNRSEARNNK